MHLAMDSVPSHRTFMAKGLSWAGILVTTVILLATTQYLMATPSPPQQIVTELSYWTLIYVLRRVCAFLGLSSTRSSPLQMSTNAPDGNTIAFCVALLCLSSSAKVVNWSVVGNLSPVS